MRKVAHRDLALALRHSSAVPLAPASEKAVEEALESIAALLNKIQRHYQGSIEIYRLEPPGNARSLLYLLQAGLQAEEDRHQRLKSGKFRREDLQRTPRL